jgi:NTP pyrophosphatase (non-canonical NTP hydrolase)
MATEQGSFEGNEFVTTASDATIQHVEPDLLGSFEGNYFVATSDVTFQYAQLGPLGQLAAEAHANSKAKGFWGGDQNFSQKCMLIVDEVSEMHDEYRDGKPDLYYDGDKPEGIGIEAADIILRLLDLTESRGIDMDEMVRIKKAYNATRPPMHGKPF